MQKVIIPMHTKINACAGILLLFIILFFVINCGGCISRQCDDLTPLCLPSYSADLLSVEISSIDFDEVGIVDALALLQASWHQAIQSKIKNEDSNRTKPRIIVFGYDLVLAYDSVESKVTFSAHDIPVLDAITYICNSVNWSKTIINGNIICYPNLYQVTEWDFKTYTLDDDIKIFFGIDDNNACDIRSKLIEFGIDEEILCARWEPIIGKLIVSMPKKEFVKLEQIFKCIILIKKQQGRLVSPKF